MASARSDINKFLFTGRVGSLNAVREAGSSTVFNFSVAVNTAVRRGEEWQEETDWINVAVWGNRGVGLSKFLEKGAQVSVEGRLRTSKRDVDGKTITYFQVNADEVIVHGGKKDRSEASPPPEPSYDTEDPFA